MKLSKRLLAALLALATAAAMTGCSGSSGEDSSYEDQIKVPSTDAIAEIPEGAENTLQWLGNKDLNPTSDAQEKSAEMTLFNDKGGKVDWIQTTTLEFNNKLSSLILANTPPDMVAFSQRMVFPCNIVKGIYQPIDELVDFDSAMWSGMKSVADQFEIAGKHYIAPAAFGDTMPLMFYNKKIIENEGLTDPYEAYLAGEWDWNTCIDVMAAYVANATGDEERYGVNGWFPEPIFATTGTTIIKYDEKTDSYVNNSKDANLERAAEYLYDMEKDGLINHDWIGNAKSAFEKNVLFYSMGRWAAATNNGPSESDDWMCVPIPKDPNADAYYRQLDIVGYTYLWVQGSTKKEAMKCWLECCRVANSSDEYKQTTKDKFFANNPNWSEEMYQMAFEEVFSDKFIQLVDPGTGISAEISDDSSAKTDTKQAINSYMYSGTTLSDYSSGAQYTWTQIREKYSPTIDSELKKFNENYKKFLKENK